MKNILISPKIIQDKHKSIGQFLDVDWINFFKKKNINLFLFTNLNNNTNVKINFDAAIISGGNDLFEIKKNRLNDIRSKIDQNIFKLAIKKNKPILAVCKGFQEINKYYGGKLKKTTHHVKKNHKIFVNENFLSLKKNQILNVNSYHNYKVDILGKNLKQLACASDGSSEIAIHKNKKILGLMFHPERNNKSNHNIKKIIFEFLKI